VIDWHSHILPGVDDGSRDVAESITMLQALSEQGVDTVIATPHFYANDEPVASFIQRRENAYRELQAHLPESAPEILLGAEVRYYPGISRLDGLRNLRIDNTKLLLLEMSFTKWTEYTVGELIELASGGDMIIILAHIERYLSMQSGKVWDRLYDSGILMQVNASFFEGFSRRKALSLLENGGIHFIGSDCHNMTSRPPQMSKAFEAIEKKLGINFISQMNEFGRTGLTLK